MSGPVSRGRFGRFGGRYVPETLMPALEELEAAYRDAREDPAFHAELAGYLREFVGRPTPLYFAERLSAHLGALRVYLKRDVRLKCSVIFMESDLRVGIES